MGAPCINDTCSIKSSIDPVTRRLNHDVVLNPSGGLKCEDGVGIEVYGDPAPSAIIDAAFQQLGITPAGEVWSVPKRAKILTFGSSASVPIPHNGDNSADPIDAEAIVNPFASPALALVAWRLRVGYTVPDANPISNNANTVDYIPFSGTLQAQLLVDNDPKVTTYLDPGGMQVSAPANKRDWREGVWAGVIGAGATWNMSARASWQVGAGNVVQRFNIETTAPDGGFPERGLRANGQVIILPLGGE